MEEKQSYEILKFVMHGDKCYMSTDVIRGKPMIIWLKYHAHITKEQFYEWVRQMITDLEHFHRCRGNPCYQYVNPYSMIVGEDGRVYLSDLAGEGQEEMMHLMQRRYVRENFLSPENQYYQKNDEQEDIYGLGKTMQYILSAVEVEPSLGHLETARIRKVIARCLNRNGRKSYQKLQDIAVHVRGTEKSAKTGKKTLVLAVLAGIVVLAAGGQAVMHRSAQKHQKQVHTTDDTGGSDVSSDAQEPDAQEYLERLLESQEQWDAEKKDMQKESAARENELLYDLAFTYFAQIKDYKLCQEYLEEMSEPDAFARDFAILCDVLNEENKGDEEIQVADDLLERMRQEIPDEEDDRYAECIEFARKELQGKDSEEQQEE